MSTPVPAPTPASRDEVLVALNELLEAERAGARVAMETARDMPPCALTTLVQDVHTDEVRWCSMLMRTIKALEGNASSATGAFWGKAMAIPDLEQRLDFLTIWREGRAVGALAFLVFEQGGGADEIVTGPDEQRWVRIDLLTH